MTMGNWDQAPPEVMEKLRDAMRTDAHIGHTVDSRTDAEVLAWFDQGLEGSGAAYAQHLAVEAVAEYETTIEDSSFGPFMQWS
jgi:hypothetical protein